MYYPYSENKGLDQLRSYCAADLRLGFRIMQKGVFSHNETLFVSEKNKSAPLFSLHR